MRTRRARIWSIVDLFGVKPDCSGRCCSSRWWRTRSRIIREKTLPALRAASHLSSCCSLGDHPYLCRWTEIPLFQSVGMMPVFQAEHRTACNDTSAAFPPALRSSARMPQIPGALPHFNRFTTACVSSNEGGPQLIGGSAVGNVTPLASNSTAGGSAWYNRSN